MHSPIWTANKVREAFISYFTEEHEHSVVPSSKVVPESDPTLLFTNAGMNQFKGVFLGKEDPNSSLMKIKRAVNSQKCIRAGGKHNDLEDVGKDTYHHTFFEMLGSWSLGDYFKKEAIPMAWDLLTKRFGLSPDRLYVTVFEGDKEAGLEEDVEAYDIWSKIVSKERILYGDMKDNFWEMGDAGPCGRCTEIHYDMIGNRDASSLVNKDDPTVVELWNLVFVEFNRESNGSLRVLPVKHVDTGMGLERLVSILQKKKSNYDSDLWTPIFAKIQESTGFASPYQEDTLNVDSRFSEINIAYRVVADHIRTLTIAITDGAVPDSTGRGYVLRRIVRRAIRFGHEFLGAPEGFLIPLVESVRETLGSAFTELTEENNLHRVRTLLNDEQVAFYKTYKLGLRHFENVFSKLALESSEEKRIVSGADAFILHDRYGFPIDLTLIMATEKGASVDMTGFDAEKTRVKNENSDKKDGQKDFLDSHAIYDMRSGGVQSTVDETKYFSEGSAMLIGRILRIYSPMRKGFVKDITREDGIVGVILDLTLFYAESGGQIYDTGYLAAMDSGSSMFHVQKVHKFAGYICHIGEVTAGIFEGGEQIECRIDEQRRIQIRSNHTMTHILNHKLRDLLQYGHPEKCVQVNQKGSFVGSNLLRFDFSWNEKISVSDLEALEHALQEDIKRDLTVYSKEVSLDDALGISSLRAIFDEKYGKTVRIVTIGISVEEIEADTKNSEKLKEYSIELCGGTHVQRTSVISDVAILSEEALTKGVRRLVCVTGHEARNARRCGDEFQAIFNAISHASTDKDIHLGDALSAIDERSKALSKLRDDVNSSAAPILVKYGLRRKIDDAITHAVKEKKLIVSKMIEKAADIGSKLVEALPSSATSVVHSIIDELGTNRDALVKLHKVIQTARGDIPIMVVVFSRMSHSGMILASSPDPDRINAVQWIKESAGKGGGKSVLAQSGFQGDVDAVLQKAKEIANRV